MESFFLVHQRPRGVNFMLYAFLFATESCETSTIGGLHAVAPVDLAYTATLLRKEDTSIVAWLSLVIEGSHTDYGVHQIQSPRDCSVLWPRRWIRGLACHVRGALDKKYQ